MSIDGVVSEAYQHTVLSGGPIHKKTVDKFVKDFDDFGGSYVLNINTGLYHKPAVYDSGPNEGKIHKEFLMNDRTTHQVVEAASHKHLVPFKTLDAMKKWAKNEEDEKADYWHAAMPNYVSDGEALALVREHPLNPKNIRECRWEKPNHSAPSIPPGELTEKRSYI